MTEIERLKAELEAAVARAEAAEAALLLAGKQMLEFGERQHSDGERRATAAIVAYLRKARGDPAYYRVCMEVDNLRNHIEAGHHLPRDAVVYAANSAFNAILAAQKQETPQ